MNAIETHGLTKYYGKTRGIIDVSLSVETGDFFGFIGPNGAGKSTFIRTLLGLISPTEGTATVLGNDIVKGHTAVLNDVGYLPGDAVFYSGMKVKDVLSLSAKLRGKNCDAVAKELCERLELDPSRKVAELSLGNRKKVGIVCALQHCPPLYILDEPTSGLDPLMQREFYEILKERNAQGATVFLSSHILSEVERYCCHAGVIREGRLQISGSVSSLGHKGVKRVTLRGFDGELTASCVLDKRQTEEGLTFLYNGTQQELLALLMTLTFDDMTVCDPDLEEVFMHYYAKEGQ